MKCDDLLSEETTKIEQMCNKPDIEHYILQSNQFLNKKRKHSTDKSEEEEVKSIKKSRITLHAFSQFKANC